MRSCNFSLTDNKVYAYICWTVQLCKSYLLGNNQAAAPVRNEAASQFVSNCYSCLCVMFPLIESDKIQSAIWYFPMSTFCLSYDSFSQYSEASQLWGLKLQLQLFYFTNLYIKFLNPWIPTHPYCASIFHSPVCLLSSLGLFQSYLKWS